MFMHIQTKAFGLPLWCLTKHWYKQYLLCLSKYKQKFWSASMMLGGIFMEYHVSENTAKVLFASLMFGESLISTVPLMFVKLQIKLFGLPVWCFMKHWNKQYWLCLKIQPNLLGLTIWCLMKHWHKRYWWGGGHKQHILFFPVWCLKKQWYQQHWSCWWKDKLKIMVCQYYAWWNSDISNIDHVSKHRNIHTFWLAVCCLMKHGYE